MVTQLFWSSSCFWAERSGFHSTPAQLCPQTLLLIVSQVYMLQRLNFDHAEPPLNGDMRSDWGLSLPLLLVCLCKLCDSTVCASHSVSPPSHSLALSWRQRWGDGRFVSVSRPQYTQRQGVGILAPSPAHVEVCTKAGQTWSSVRILTETVFFLCFLTTPLFCASFIVLFPVLHLGPLWRCSRRTRQDRMPVQPRWSTHHRRKQWTSLLKAARWVCPFCQHLHSIFFFFFLPEIWKPWICVTAEDLFLLL